MWQTAHCNKATRRKHIIVADRTKASSYKEQAYHCGRPHNGIHASKRNAMAFASISNETHSGLERDLGQYYALTIRPKINKLHSKVLVKLCI
jgi:retron-type reverse transcriptase